MDKLFNTWGSGRPLPARSAFVADFLDEQIVRGASAGAIRLLSAAISFAHRINDHADPCVATVVKLVVRAAWLSRKKTKKGKTNGQIHH